MVRIGLTGNIASGKSSVARVWSRLGAPVIDADVLARRAVEPGSDGLRRIVEAFGPGVLERSGALDRAALRGIIFEDEAARRRLEAIVHPEVERLRLEEEAGLLQSGSALVVHEIPLLYEVGLGEHFDAVVLVDAPASVRRERLVRDRGLSIEEAARMISSQMPAETKRRRADIIIDNTGTLPELEAEAEDVWNELRHRASSSA